MVKTEKFLPTKTTYYFTATTNRANRWLDLSNVACPIRSVTIVDRHPPELPIYNIADYTWSRIREYVESLPDVKVAFDVIFETQDQAIAGAWNEWGPNLQ
ncbi:hypothetical protein BJ912DRAFT_1064024 [Pholiota molesta]|nr:hypothetical protein BJ912DRAFT_1064024 [Pholiota molesta]